jgi:hypothetical protein
MGHVFYLRWRKRPHILCDFSAPLISWAIRGALFNMYGAINTIYIIYPFCKEMLDAEFPWSNYGSGILDDGAVDAEAVEKIEVL